MVNKIIKEMATTIKFRGVPLDDYSHDANVDFDGTFIYGNYEKVGDDVLISSGKIDVEGIFIPDLFAKVDPKTVGQFTGLKDVNGKDIYEGDLVRLTDDLEDPIYKVIFDEAKFEIIGGWVCYDLGEDFMDCEVIGNVHENPELLEADK